MEETLKSERKNKFQKSSFKLIFTVAFVIVLMLAALHWLSSEGYWLQEIRTPKEFERAGITEDSLNVKIIAHIKEIKNTVVSNSDDWYHRDINFPNSITPVSFGGEVNQVAHSLGILRAKKITVDIALHQNKAKVLVNIQGQPPVESEVNAGSLNTQQTSDAIAQNIAESILKISNSSLLAYFYYLTTIAKDVFPTDEDFEKTIALVKYGLAHATDSSKNKYYYLVWAKTLHRQRKYIEALEKAKRAIANDSRFIDGYLAAARSLKRLRQYENERTFLQNALRLAHDKKSLYETTLCYTEIVNSYLLQKKNDAIFILSKDSVKKIISRFYTSTIADIRKAHAQENNWDDRKMIDMYYAIGDFYFETGFYDSTIAYSKRALHYDLITKSDETIAWRYSHLAYDFFKMGYYDSAMANERKALRYAHKIKSKREAADLYNDIADHYSKYGYYDSAFANAQKAIQADSTFPQTYTTLAEIYGYKKDREKFYFYVQKAFEKGCKTYTQDDIENPVPPYNLYSKEERLKKLWKKYVLIH